VIGGHTRNPGAHSALEGLARASQVAAVSAGFEVLAPFELAGVRHGGAEGAPHIHCSLACLEPSSGPACRLCGGRQWWWRIGHPSRAEVEQLLAIKSRTQALTSRLQPAYRQSLCSRRCSGASAPRGNRTQFHDADWLTWASLLCYSSFSEGHI